MTWIKLDDSFDENPKILACSDAAFRLYIAGLCFSSRTLSDGYVSAAALRRLGGDTTTATELVHRHLWTTAGDGWQIHGYTDHQRSRAQIESEREAAKQRAKASRERAQQSGVQQTRVDSTRSPNFGRSSAARAAHASPDCPHCNGDATVLDRTGTAYQCACVGGPGLPTLKAVH